MNILFNTFGGNQATDVVNKLIERYKPENCLGILCDNEAIAKRHSGFTYYFDYRNVYSCRYDRELFYQESTPVDKKLLESLAPFEPHVLKMMERNHTHQLDFDSRVNVYHEHLRYWNYILDKFNVELFICFNIPHEIFDYVIYLLCKIKGIKVIASFISPVMEYSYLLDDIHTGGHEVVDAIRKLEKKYELKPIEDIKLTGLFYDVFVNFTTPGMDITPYYMRENVSKIKKLTAKALRPFKYVLRLIDSTNNGSKVKTGISKFGKRFSEYLAQRKLFKYYSKNAVEPDVSQKYIYVPLHFQPECTTSPMAGVFVHQIIYIKMLSYHIPKDVWLYVKEHPKQELLGRSVHLYEELLKLQNVKLIKKHIDTNYLTGNCIAVATPTGTAGFEGLFKGKPFLMFGSFINQFAPGVFKIETNEDCKNALNKILNEGFKPNIRQLKIYLAALQEVTFHGYYDDGSYKTEYPIEENIKQMSNAFINSIDKVFSDVK